MSAVRSVSVSLLTSEKGVLRSLCASTSGATLSTILLECVPAQYDLNARLGLPHGLDADTQSEPIQQLGTDIPFFRVHGSDKDEPCRMSERDALALNHIHAHRSSIQESIDQVIIEQVHFIDVEDAPVGGGEEPGMKRPFAFSDGGLEIERAYQAVLGCRHRQIDHTRHRPDLGQRPLVATISAVIAPLRRIARIAPVLASLHHIHLGKHSEKRAHSRGFRGPLLAPDEHAAYARVDSIEQKGELECLLPDDGGERELLWESSYYFH
jgi:hypothetical protein